MSNIVLMQEDFPSVQIQDTANVTVLDNPEISIYSNYSIVVASADIPVIVKYNTKPGADGHSPTGEEITALITPEYLLTKLSGQIKSTELYSGLASRINYIDALDSDVFDLKNAVATAVQQDSMSGYFTDYKTIADAEADIAWATKRDALISTVGTNTAIALSQYTTTSDLTSVISGKIDTLLASGGNSLGDVKVALEIEQEVRAKSLAPLWSNLKEYQKGEVVMLLDGRLYQCKSEINDSPNRGLSPPDTPFHWTLIAANIYAQYNVKTDVNGHVAGFGLSNNGLTSDFIILADRFSIVDPDDHASTVVPFTVTDGKAYMNSAVIVNAVITDASITTAMIATGAITNGLIADTISSGHTEVNGTYHNTYVAGANGSGWEISSIDGTIKGKGLIVEDGSITNAKIGDTIQSNNYVEEISGWKLWKEPQTIGGVANVNAALNGVVLSRNLRVADGYISDSVGPTYLGEETYVAHFFIDTGWSDSDMNQYQANSAQYNYIGDAIVIEAAYTHYAGLPDGNIFTFEVSDVEVVRRSNYVRATFGGSSISMITGSSLWLKFYVATTNNHPSYIHTFDLQSVYWALKRVT